MNSVPFETTIVVTAHEEGDVAAWLTTARAAEAAVEIVVAHALALDVPTSERVREYRAADAAELSANAAAQLARGEQLVFVDGGWRGTTGWLAALLSALRECEASIVCGTAVDGGGHRVDREFTITARSGLPRAESVPPRDGRHECRAASGGPLLTRTADFRAVGGFDEGFDAIHRDVDLCERLRTRTNRPVVVCPEASGKLARDRSPPAQYSEQRFTEKWLGRIAPDRTDDDLPAGEWLARLESVGPFMHPHHGPLLCLTFQVTDGPQRGRCAVRFLPTNIEPTGPDSEFLETLLGLDLSQAASTDPSAAIGRPFAIVAVRSEPGLTLVGRLSPAVAESLANLKRLQAAEELLERNQPVAALGPLQEVLGTEPENVVATHHVARALAALGRLGDAVTWFERTLAIHPQNESAFTHLVATVLRAGGLDEARRAFVRHEAAIVASPGKMELCHAIFSNGLNGIAASSGSAPNAQQEPPEPASGPSPAEIRQAFEAASEHHVAGRHTEALRGYSALLRVDAENPELWRRLGVLCHQMNRPDHAVQYLERAAELAPNHHDVLLSLGQVYSEAGVLDKAEAALRRSVAAGATLGSLRSWGDVLWRLGRKDEARKAFDLVLENDAFCVASRANAEQCRRDVDQPRGTLPRLRISLLTCVWQRPELTDFVLGCYAALRDELKDGMELDLLAAGSEGAASRRRVERHGFRYVECGNRPLGRKWNVGLAALRSSSPDAVAIVGSDDLLNARYFELVAAGLRRGYDLFGLMDLFYLDLRSETLVHWPGYHNVRIGETVGLGRCLSRRLLDRFDWCLWEDDLDSALDRSMTSRVLPVVSQSGDFRSAAFRCREFGVSAIDVKSDVNIWSFAQMAEVSDIEPVDAAGHFATYHRPEYLTALRTLGTGK